MIRALIVENEVDAKSLLSCIINDYCVGVELVGTADSVKSAIDQIEICKPDLLFLDIELNGESSFDLLDEINFQDFNIIFTTAYDNHALRAFGYEAIDYILKPYSPKDVLKAISRVKRKQYEEVMTDKIHKLVDNISSTKERSKISLSTSEGINILDVNQITRLEADKVYTTIFMASGQRHVASKILKKFEKILPLGRFIRTHSGHIINKDFINKFVSEDGGFVVMFDGSQVPIARRRKHAFLEQISYA